MSFGHYITENWWKMSLNLTAQKKKKKKSMPIALWGSSSTYSAIALRVSQVQIPTRGPFPILLSVLICPIVIKAKM